MHSEITTGENPVLTSFVGASAPPNHVEAAIAQKTPSPCMDRITGTVLAVVKGILGVMRFSQVLQGLIGRLGGDGFNPAERRNESLRIHESIAPRIGETRQIYAGRLKGVKHYFAKSGTTHTGNVRKHLRVKLSRFMLLSCAENIQPANWQELQAFRFAEELR